MLMWLDKPFQHNAAKDNISTTIALIINIKCRQILTFPKLCERNTHGRAVALNCESVPTEVSLK